MFRNCEMHKEAIDILATALQKEEGWKSAVVLADVPEFLEMITVNQATQKRAGRIFWKKPQNIIAMKT
jgi:hypothetical protein